MVPCRIWGRLEIPSRKEFGCCQAESHWFAVSPLKQTRCNAVWSAETTVQWLRIMPDEELEIAIREWLRS
jgi:2-polyprenyl-6-methoxyphenol hydroxylase-like FAD-dependent oxidoreductase